MLNEGYSIRPATMADVGFIAKTIIEAEKSLTNNLGLANFFELSEEEIRQYIVQILEEEVDGCEFSLSSYLVADYQGKAVAAMGGWLEGAEEGMPSALLKANLISFVFPMENILKTKPKQAIIQPLQIEREMGSYQLEYSYTEPEHRGKRLINEIMKKHLACAKELYKDCKKAQLHVFENNETIIKVHQRSGYKIAKRYTSDVSRILEYLPYNVVLLMEKEF